MLAKPRPWLAPLAPLYWLGARVHGAWMRVSAPSGADFRPAIPLVVVGALRAGGSGKTAVTLELARQGRARGWNVAVLAYRLGRGGGILSEVEADGDWREGSDEACMLRRLSGARVFVTRDRARAWRALHVLRDAGGARPFDLILSDDGFQDPRLDGAFRLLLAAPGVRPALWDLLPAGPYRETWSARRRADLILAGPHDFSDGPRVSEAPGFRSRTILPPDLDRTRPWALLCGLGDNAAFVAEMRRAGLEPALVLEARDHAVVPEVRILRAARRHPGLGFLCTRKDWIKLDAAFAARHGIVPVDREIALDPTVMEAIEAYRGRFPRTALVHYPR